VNQAPRDSASLPLWVLMTVMAALVFGIVARLVWLEDMEWKADEIYSVETCVEINREPRLERVGVRSAGGH
jgi:hypothetical protein